MGTAPTELVVARERLADCIGEVAVLGRVHHEELEAGDYEYQPDLTHYCERETAGELRFFAMRGLGGNPHLPAPMVGYTLLHVAKNPHGTGTIACEELVFIDKVFRGRGVQLIRESDRALAAEGITRVFRCVHMGAERDHGPVLARMGYAPAMQWWGRPLKSMEWTDAHVADVAKELQES